MEDQDLEDYAQESVKEGYTKEELQNVLMEEGFDEERVEGVLSEIDDSKFAQSIGSTITGLELEDKRYEIVQSLIRNKYKVSDSEGSLVMKASQKLFRPKESFSFRDSEGNAVFDIDAEQILDFSGDYTLKDSETEEAFAVLEKEFTIFQHRWKLKDPDGNALAEITSRSSILDFLRKFSDFFALIPHKYTIESVEGERLGVIEGKLGIRDRYILDIEENSEIPTETLVAAAVTADALE